MVTTEGLISQIEQNNFLGLESILEEKCASVLRGELEISALDEFRIILREKVLKGGYQVPVEDIKDLECYKPETASLLSCALLIGDSEVFNKAVSKIVDNPHGTRIHSTGHVLAEIVPSLLLSLDLKSVADAYGVFMKQLIDHTRKVLDYQHQKKPEDIKFALEQIKYDLIKEWYGPVLHAFMLRGEDYDSLNIPLVRSEYFPDRFQYLKLLLEGKVRNKKEFKDWLTQNLNLLDSSESNGGDQDLFGRMAAYVSAIFNCDIKLISGEINEILSTKNLTYLSKFERLIKSGDKVGLTLFQSKGSEGTLIENKNNSEGEILYSSTKEKIHRRKVAIKSYYPKVSKDRSAQQYVLQNLAARHFLIYQHNTRLNLIDGSTENIPREWTYSNNLFSTPINIFKEIVGLAKPAFSEEDWKSVCGVDRQIKIGNSSLSVSLGECSLYLNDEELSRDPRHFLCVSEGVSIRALPADAYAAGYLFMPKIEGPDLSDYPVPLRFLLRQLYDWSFPEKCELCGSRAIPTYRHNKERINYDIIYSLLDGREQSLLESYPFAESEELFDYCWKDSISRLFHHKMQEVPDSSILPEFTGFGINFYVIDL